MAVLSKHELPAVTVGGSVDFDSGVLPIGLKERPRYGF
jgi:hypothetical protein